MKQFLMSEVPLYHTPAVLGLLAFGAQPPAAHRDLEIDEGDRALSPVSADGWPCSTPVKVPFLWRPQNCPNHCFDANTQATRQAPGIAYIRTLPAADQIRLESEFHDYSISMTTWPPVFWGVVQIWSSLTHYRGTSLIRNSPLPRTTI